MDPGGAPGFGASESSRLLDGSQGSSSALPPIVRRLGWVAFFTDAAGDMIYPLLPAFLVSLGAGAGALGWVEGIAEGTSALVKVWSGRISDRAGSRKPFVVLGYGIATIVRPMLALATAPWHVVLVRATDRFGKGLRAPSRDAMVAQVVAPSERGLAYGFHQMMDNLGAVLGPAIAFALARGLGFSPRTIFVCALAPGLLALVTVTFGVKEAPRHEGVAKSTGIAPSDGTSAAMPRRGQDLDGTSAAMPRRGQDLDEKLAPVVKRYLIVVAIFTLGASADSFLLLRMLDLGLPVAWTPLAWLTLNASKAATNMPGGRLSDRFGRKKTLALAWTVYAAAYTFFPMTHSVPITWAILVGYGAYYGLAEGGEKAILAELAPGHQRGRAFGLLHAVTGVAVLPANALFGLLYERGPSYAFGASAAFALSAALLLMLQGEG
jgi:MFS family permease